MESTCKEDNASTKNGIEVDYIKNSVTITGEEAYFSPISELTNDSSRVLVSEEKKKKAIERGPIVAVETHAEEEMTYLFSMLACPETTFENLDAYQIGMAEDATGLNGSQLKKAQGIECNFFEILSTEFVTQPFSKRDANHGRLFTVTSRGIKTRKS